MGTHHPYHERIDQIKKKSQHGVARSHVLEQDQLTIRLTYSAQFFYSQHRIGHRAKDESRKNSIKKIIGESQLLDVHFKKLHIQIFLQGLFPGA